jgi:hypothetical protein
MLVVDKVTEGPGKPASYKIVRIDKELPQKAHSFVTHLRRYVLER